MRTKAIDRLPEVVIRASDEIPPLHVGSNGGIDRHETPMEETTAEITKVFILHIIASTCEI